MFGLLIWADKRFDLTGGRLFAMYVAAYTVGRVGIEALRVDHANHILGLRLNVWTSIVIFAAATAYLAWRQRAETHGEHEPAQQSSRTESRSSSPGSSS